MRNAETGTLVDHLFAFIEKQPDRIALQAGTVSLSYAEFGARILATAERLRAQGIESQDRVLISGPNDLAFPILYFAIHALGAIAAPVAPETPEEGVAALAAAIEAKLAVMDRRPAGMPCEVAAAAQLTGAPDSALRFRPVCSAGDIADILFTTGTTGKKKGVVLTHANVLAAARNMTEFIGTTAEDVEVVPLPLSHSFGLGRLRSLAVAGHTIVLEPGVGNGARVVKRVIDSGATGLALVPAGFEILRQVTGDALGRAAAHLRYIEIGSAAMKPETREWLMRLLPRTRICHHYGLTEASRAAFTEYHADSGKPGTVGKAAPNVTITICGEDGNRVGCGSTGEVVVSGGMVMREYWRAPELTREAFCVHGLRTGDIGYMDPDGHLFLMGRRSDLINVGGRKVIPDEIEELICQMDGIQDAGCVPMPDALLGEAVKAFVVTDRPVTRGEIVAFLRTKVEEYKIPLVVERIERIPRTGSGKIQRQQLRDLKEATLGS